MEALWLPAREVVRDAAGVIRAEIPIPEGLGWLKGHFPDFPILPGVALLAIASDAIRARGGAAGPIHVAGLRKVRFRRVLRAGATLSLVATPSWEGDACAFAFDMTQRGQIACRGTFLTTRGEPAPAHEARIPAPRGDAAIPPLPSLEDLIPHRAPMKLIESLETLWDAGATALARVRPEWPTFESGSVDATLLVELVAQTAGAQTGWVSKLRGIGLLAGVLDAAFFAPRVPAGTELAVHVEIVRRVENYAVFRGVVVAGARPLAEMSIQVFRPDDPQALP